MPISHVALPKYALAWSWALSPLYRIGVISWVKGSLHVLFWILHSREKGGSANFKIKHTEPLTQEIPPALYNAQKYFSRLICPNQGINLKLPFHQPISTSQGRV